MIRPSRESVIMEVAHAYAKRGTCLRAKVGATLARDGRVLATGYNGPPAGLPHCDQQCYLAHSTGCLVAVHAEANAISYAARYGIATDGAELFCTHLPCRACAMLIVNAGIVRVTYHTDYRDHSGLDLLQQAGVDIMMLA